MAKYTPGKPLTVKQAAFVREYPVDWDGGKAVRRAKYAVKSDKSAWEIASQLLKLPQVQEALENEKARLAAEVGVTAKMVLQGFADGAFADLAECYNEDGTLKKIHDIPKSTRMALAGLEVDEIYVGQGEERTLIGQTKKIKKWDNHKYLDSLAKHFGLYDADNKQKPENALLVLLQRIDGQGLPKPKGDND